MRRRLITMDLSINFFDYSGQNFKAICQGTEETMGNASDSGVLKLIVNLKITEVWHRPKSFCGRKTSHYYSAISYNQGQAFHWLRQLMQCCNITALLRKRMNSRQRVIYLRSFRQL